MISNVKAANPPYPIRAARLRCLLVTRCACSVCYAVYIAELPPQQYMTCVVSWLHCAPSLAAQCIVIGPVCGGRACGWAGVVTGGRAESEHPARARCLRLSERFIHWQSASPGRPCVTVSGEGRRSESLNTPPTGSVVKERRTNVLARRQWCSVARWRQADRRRVGGHISTRQTTSTRQTESDRLWFWCPSMSALARPM